MRRGSADRASSTFCGNAVGFAMPQNLPGTNRLIVALPARDRRCLLDCCEEVELSPAEVIFEPGQRIRHVFFPTRGFISLTTPVFGHPSLAVGLIGDEGMLGIWLMLGIGVAPLHAEVQGKVTAWRLDAGVFVRELVRSQTLRQRLDRYLYVTLTQRTQAAACACFHLVEARLARWLLMTRDRAHAGDFHITHEYLAGILGVRRAGITRAAISLQTRGLIRYRRGAISIIDNRGLEAAACECYSADRKTYSRALR